MKALHHLEEKALAVEHKLAAKAMEVEHRAHDKIMEVEHHMVDDLKEAEEHMLSQAEQKKHQERDEQSRVAAHQRTFDTEEYDTTDIFNALQEEAKVRPAPRARCSEQRCPPLLNAVLTPRRAPAAEHGPVQCPGQATVLHDLHDGRREARQPDPAVVGSVHPVPRDLQLRLGAVQDSVRHLAVDVRVRLGGRLLLLRRHRPGLLDRVRPGLRGHHGKAHDRDQLPECAPPFPRSAPPPVAIVSRC